MTITLKQALWGGVMLALVSSGGTWLLRDALAQENDAQYQLPKGQNVPVVSMYTGPDGTSHFRDIEIPVSRIMNLGGGKKDPKAPGASSQIFKTPGVQLRVMPNSKDFNNWHPESRKQYMVVLRGALELQVSDGTTRILRPGDILLAEDRTGKGHRSRGVGDVDRIQLFIPIEEGSH